MRLDAARTVSIPTASAGPFAATGNSKSCWRRLEARRSPAAAAEPGPPLVGKTALVHEFIYRRARRQTRRRHELPASDPLAKVWLLAPQRLISGMSYVGQWENRLLAILKESRGKNGCIFSTSTICSGLYHAGVTSQSSLSVADVHKPCTSSMSEVRTTCWPKRRRSNSASSRERDRGFADMFQLVFTCRSPATRRRCGSCSM